MDRLINENDVIKQIETVYNLRGEVKAETFQAIDRCKTVDAEPVVRCADCKYWHMLDVEPDKGRCWINSGLWGGDEFCSMGKEGEQT